MIVDSVCAASLIKSVPLAKRVLESLQMRLYRFVITWALGEHASEISSCCGKGRGAGDWLAPLKRLACVCEFREYRVILAWVVPEGSALSPECGAPSFQLRSDYSKYANVTRAMPALWRFRETFETRGSFNDAIARIVYFVLFIRVCIQTLCAQTEWHLMTFNPTVCSGVFKSRKSYGEKIIRDNFLRTFRERIITGKTKIFRITQSHCNTYIARM